jgi:hypothetical protein
LEAGQKQFEEAKRIGLLSAATQQRMAQEVGNVMTNPNKAGSVRTGAASNIATQRGAELSGLAAQQTAATGLGSAYSAQAGLTAPRQQGYVMLDPTTGKPIGGEGGAYEAIAQGAKYNAYEQGVGASAVDTQSINGAESGIASITDLIQKGNLNPNTVNLVNEGIQAIKGNLSDADYMTLLNSLEAINAALTKVTGTPVDIAKLSSSQGTSLIATINNQVQIAKAFAAGKAKAQGSNTGDPLGLGI